MRGGLHADDRGNHRERHQAAPEDEPGHATNALRGEARRAEGGFDRQTRLRFQGGE